MYIYIYVDKEKEEMKKVSLLHRHIVFIYDKKECKLTFFNHDIHKYFLDRFQYEK